MSSIITPPASASAAGVATVEAIRAHFPALARRAPGADPGQTVAYFDGPGGTQVASAVVDAMAEYLLHHNANTHWRYPTSAETDAIILRARQTLADFVNGAPDEIAFGQNMTSLTFHLARGLGRAWGRGDEIVITELDHHANVAPWRALERERGVTIRVVPMNVATGRLEWDALERAITPRTKLVAVGAASNALGTITDVRAATALAHAVGALAFVDAVHYAPHHLVNVREIGCDFLACSAYKFYGPHIGILWGRRALIEATDVPRLAPAPQESPERLETGTQSHEAIAGAAAAVDFLAGLAARDTGKHASDPATRRGALVSTFSELHRRGEALVEQLWDGLASIDGVTMYGPRPGTPRTPTVAFTLRGHTTDAVAEALAARGVFVSNGDFYAATVIERLGTPDGVVRAGCSCYTTAAEVDRLIDAVRSLAA